jgi:alpha-glucosidase
MDDLKWWQQAVFYQIYPRSFADGDGDGIGDFTGMISRLDYLQDLGVDAIWLSPHYPSPLYDCGYDVADYTGVAPEYGTLNDFRRFLDGLHQRGMRLILDLVLNHTSDRHRWFSESRSTLDNPKRDWYIWSDGKNGGPPNNWYSIFGGPAWEYDALTGQYYYHFFFKEQPDLNWYNPEVREAMFNVMRFWLDIGVDGFRLDAIGTLFEDQALHDHVSALTQAEFYALDRQAGSPAEREQALAQFMDMFGLQVDRPEIHEVMRLLRGVCDEYKDRLLVGETEDLSYYGQTGEDELHMVFNFPLMKTDRLTPAWIRANQQERLAGLPPKGWPCNTLGNHDSPRLKTHFGDGVHDDAIARQCLALMLTLRGTPFLYNGEEIGMTDFTGLELDQFKDLLGLWAYQMERDSVQAPQTEILLHANLRGRDKCRTPFQWNGGPNGGFSPAGIEPWLPVNPNYSQDINVKAQLADPQSLLHFYRRMLRVRRENPALVSGEYMLAPGPHAMAGDTLAFYRCCPTQTCLVLQNWSDQPQSLDFSLYGGVGRLLFSSRAGEPGTTLPDEVELAPFETLITRPLARQS